MRPSIGSAALSLLEAARRSSSSRRRPAAPARLQLGDRAGAIALARKVIGELRVATTWSRRRAVRGHDQTHYATFSGTIRRAAAAARRWLRRLQPTDFLVDVLKMERALARFDGRSPTTIAALIARDGRQAAAAQAARRDAWAITEMTDCETCCGFGGTFDLFGEFRAQTTSAAILPPAAPIPWCSETSAACSTSRADCAAAATRPRACCTSPKCWPGSRRERHARRIDAFQGARAQEPGRCAAPAEPAEIPRKVRHQAPRGADRARRRRGHARRGPRHPPARARQPGYVAGDLRSQRHASRRDRARASTPDDVNRLVRDRGAMAPARSSNPSRWSARNPRSTAPSSARLKVVEADLGSTSCRSTTMSRRRTSSDRRCTRARKRFRPVHQEARTPRGSRSRSCASRRASAARVPPHRGHGISRFRSRRPARSCWSPTRQRDADHHAALVHVACIEKIVPTSRTATLLRRWRARRPGSQSRTTSTS